MTDDLATFLRARLDEDEAAAKAAGGGAWEYRDTWVWSGPFEIADIVGPDMDVTGEHIALHDPDRALREVEAKRVILEDLRSAASELDQAVTQAATTRGSGTAWESEDLARVERKRVKVATLEIAAIRIAAVWSDHPDYRQEWAVTGPAAAG